MHKTRAEEQVTHAHKTHSLGRTNESACGKTSLADCSLHRVLVCWILSLCSRFVESTQKDPLTIACKNSAARIRARDSGVRRLCSDTTTTTATAARVRGAVRC